MCKVYETYKLKIGGIVNDSIVDGPGLRLAIFIQGCERKCRGCHNPQLWDFNSGKDFFIQDLLDIAKSNPLLDGITFSGGEPFCQAENLFYAVKLFKENNYNIAVYSGYLFEELINNKKFLSVLSFVDTLIDGAFILEKRDLKLKFRGSENQRIIDMQKSLEQKKIILNKDWY